MPIVRFCIVLSFSLCLAAACLPQQPAARYTGTGTPIVEWPHSSNLIYARPPELLKKYQIFLVEKPVIMGEEEAKHPDVTLEEEETMLFFTRQAYSQAFRRNGFNLAEKPGAGIARVKLYLLEMRPSRPVPEGVIYKTPIGEIDLTDMDFRGRSVFTGGVTLVGTVTDSDSGSVLMGFVESSSQINLDPVDAFHRWFPAQRAIEASAGSLAVGWRGMLSR